MADLVEAASDADRRSGVEIADRTLFLIVLAAVTVFPLTFVPFAAPIRDSVATVDEVFRVLLIMSTAHVGLTAYFYFDTDYRRHALQHSKFYIWLPLALIVFSGAVTTLMPITGIIYLQIFYHAWLLFHYGRQNYGILAFSAIATDTPRPLLSERLALHFAPLGGIFGAHAVFHYFRQSEWSAYASQSFTIGVVFTIAAVGCAFYAAVRHTYDGVPLIRSFIIVGLSLFYVPTFFYDNYFQAVMGYAVAHALQYFVFMFFLASGHPRLRASTSIIVLVAAMLLVWGLIVLTREPAIWGPAAPFVVGAALGLIMWHFILDAGFWRLSQNWQREQVKERYSFLFESAASRHDP